MRTSCGMIAPFAPTGAKWGNDQDAPAAGQGHKAAISATRVLPALVGSATTRSSETSAERFAASRCDGQSSTSAFFRAYSEAMNMRRRSGYFSVPPSGGLSGRFIWSECAQRSSIRLRQILLVGVVIKIGKRHYNDRQARHWCRGGSCARDSGDRDSVHAHWAGDVVQSLLAEIAEGHIELSGGVLLDPRRDAHAARFGERFEAGGDVDAVAENVAVSLDKDVALMDADAKLDALLRRAALSTRRNGEALCGRRGGDLRRP